jgi:hypothetical protein
MRPVIFDIWEWNGSAWDYRGRKTLNDWELAAYVPEQGRFLFLRKVGVQW